MAATAADPIIIKYASPYTPTHVFGKADQDFFAKIEQETGGKVKFQPNWAKSLITDREGMEQLSSGIAAIFHIALLILFPALVLFLPNL